MHGYKNNSKVEKRREGEGEGDEGVKDDVICNKVCVYFSPHLRPEGRRQVGPSLTMNIYSRFEEVGIGWDYTCGEENTCPNL